MLGDGVAAGAPPPRVGRAVGAVHTHHTSRRCSTAPAAGRRPPRPFAVDLPRCRRAAPLRQQRPRFVPGMAVGPYTLRLFPPPRLDAVLFPQLRPHLHRRVSTRVAAAGTSWSPAAGDSEDGVGGWWFPEYEKPIKQGRRRIGNLIVSRQVDGEIFLPRGNLRFLSRGFLLICRFWESCRGWARSFCGGCLGWAGLALPIL